jgi:hypothetical protein
MKVVDINELKIKLDLVDNVEDIRKILQDVAFNTVPYYVVKTDCVATSDDDRISLPHNPVKNLAFIYPHRSYAYKSICIDPVHNEVALVLDNEGNVHQFDMHGKEHVVQIIPPSIENDQFMFEADHCSAKCSRDAILCI